MKLNLGCGSQVLEGWINVDYALGAKLAKLPLFAKINRKAGLFGFDWNERIHLHDLTKPLPWPDESTRIIYSSHTLEHLSREQGRQLLKECHRVLQRAGILRIIVPDLHHHVEEYLAGRIQADDFVATLGVLYGHSNNPVKRRLAPFIQFPHKCMYDTPRMLALFDEFGFDAAARGPFDSDIDEIHDLELENRTRCAVIVEGRKR